MWGSWRCFRPSVDLLQPHPIFHPWTEQVVAVRTRLCFQCQGLEEDLEGFLQGQPPRAVSGTPRLKLGVPVHEGLVTETQLPLTPAQRVHCFVPLGAKGWSPEAQVRLLSLCISHWFCHFLNSRQALASVSPTTEGLSPSLPYPALELIISLSRDKRKKESASPASVGGKGIWVAQIWSRL